MNYECPVTVQGNCKYCGQYVGHSGICQCHQMIPLTSDTETITSLRAQLKDMTDQFFAAQQRAAHLQEQHDKVVGELAETTKNLTEWMQTAQRRADKLEVVSGQLGEAQSKQPINTHIRLFDLVRYMRAELHAKELITDDEYAWLSGGASMAHSKEGGSPSPRRLEDYDAIQAQLARLRAENKAMRELLEKLIKKYEGTTARYERVATVAFGDNGITERTQIDLHEAKNAIREARRLLAQSDSPGAGVKGEGS